MSQYSEEQLKKAFDTFDMNKSGFIEPVELKCLLTEQMSLSKDVADKICQLTFDAHDSNKDDKISFDEFKTGLEKEGLATK